MTGVPNHTASCLPHIHKLLTSAPHPREFLIDYVAQGLRTGIKDAKKIISHLKHIGVLKESKVSDPSGRNVAYIGLTDHAGRSG